MENTYAAISLVWAAYKNQMDITMEKFLPVHESGYIIREIGESECWKDVKNNRDQRGRKKGALAEKTRF